MPSVVLNSCFVKRRIMKIFVKILRWAAIAFFGSTILAVVLFRFLPVYFTPLMFIRCFEQVADGESIKLHHHWVPMERISPHMPVAVMASEDARFLLHHGLDYEAIEKAAVNNMKGKKKHGASTITQQTAKNVFLWPGRSWIRKGFEAYFTVLIEFMWSKQRIMEVYLNSIEMGDGIYGVEAVANDNFNTTADMLSRGQCAQIAATLPNPRKFSSKNPSAYMLKRRSQIEHQMRFIPSFPREGEDINPETSAGGVYRNYKRK